MLSNVIVPEAPASTPTTSEATVSNPMVFGTLHPTSSLADSSLIKWEALRLATNSRTPS